MIEKETIEVWRKIDRSYRFFTFFWVGILCFDLTVLWLATGWWMIAIDGIASGFSICAFGSNVMLRRQFWHIRMITISYDGIIEHQNEAIRLLADERRNIGEAAAPDPTLWPRDTRH